MTVTGRKLLLILLAVMLFSVILPAAVRPASAAGGEVSITAQPQTQRAAVGQRASFSVTAVNAETYQWQYSIDGSTWVNCRSAGCDTDTFSFTVSASLDGRQYRCVVSGTGGTKVTSSAAALYVKPSITVQPVSVSGVSGRTVSLKVTAKGPALTYQWQYKNSAGTWVNCRSAGYDTATFSFKASVSLDGRQYRCVVKNSRGSATSSAAALTVISEPEITSDPQDQTKKVGETATFKVAAAGKNLTYRWQYSTNSGTTWTDCRSTGYNTATFSFKASRSLDGRKYRCVVENDAGDEKSESAELTVIFKPEITKQPVNITTAPGGTAEFRVGAAGGALTYQWQYKNSASSWVNCVSAGHDKDTFSFKASVSLNGRQYRCVVKNSQGSAVSEPATLTVSELKITKQPAAQTVSAGGRATFSVTASGAGVQYQWQYSKNGTTWVNLSSVTARTPTLTVTAQLSYNGYRYRCIVTDGSGGSATSNAAKLTVK